VKPYAFLKAKKAAVILNSVTYYTPFASPVVCGCLLLIFIVTWKKSAEAGTWMVGRKRRENRHKFRSEERHTSYVSHDFITVNTWRRMGWTCSLQTTDKNTYFLSGKQILSRDICVAEEKH